MFVLVSALFFALAACSGAKEEPIPGTYEAVSLYDAPAYQLNENGSYDHGEQKGTYTTDSDRNIVLSPKMQRQISRLPHTVPTTIHRAVWTKTRNTALPRLSMKTADPGRPSRAQWTPLWR